MSENKLFAIPTERGETAKVKRSAHFGRSDQFTLIRVDGRGAAIFNTIDNIPHEAGGCMAPISLLKKREVDGVIAGGMGEKLLAGFAEAGINVYWSPLADYPLVDDVIVAITSGKLQEMSLQHACSGLGCHQD